MHNKIDLTSSGKAEAELYGTLDKDIELKNATTLLTRKEAAELLRCKESTLAIWKYTGKHSLPCIKIGKHVRYRLSDLICFIDKNVQS